jgi:hypothetical protein
MLVVVLLAIATMAGVTYFRGAAIITDLADTAGMEVVKSATKNIDEQFDNVEYVCSWSRIRRALRGTQPRV